MTAQDANLAGHVHGGVIVKHIDNTAAIVAIRHTNCNVATVSIDRVDFYSPVYVGDLLRVALVITPATALAAWTLVRTADPTDRGLTVGSAVRTERRWPEL